MRRIISFPATYSSASNLSDDYLLFYIFTIILILTNFDIFSFYEGLTI